MSAISRVVAGAGVAAACMLLISCAAEVSRTPTEFIPATASESGGAFLVTQDVIAEPESGFRSKIRGGTTWKYVGRTPQGSVFQIKDDAFTLVGRHLHEAYCVIAKSNQLVGFFLPVEKAFVPLSSAVTLPVVYK